MNDDELRMLIRAAIRRHMSADEGAVPARPVAVQAGDAGLSFAQYQIARAVGDTMCVIEPDVHCNHCGFCKCHGH